MIFTDDEIVQQFQARREARLDQEWGSYQPRHPIASDLTDCWRYQVMRIIAWKVREQPNVKAKAVIEQGRVMEAPMISQLQKEGWQIVEQQSPFEIRQPLESGGRPRTIVAGRIDGKIRINGELMPFDVKDTSEYMVGGIHSEHDLKQSQWTRKWWRQMQIYMLGENYECSLLYLGFRGDRNPVILHLDYEEAEQILQMCTEAVKLTGALLDAGVTHETVNDALKDRGVSYCTSFEICRSCPFRDRACFPPEPSATTAQLRTDLQSAAARYLELKPLSSEYEKLKNKLKKETDSVPITIAGDFIIEGAPKTRRMKAQPAKPEYVQEYWSFEVHPLQRSLEPDEAA